MSKTVVIGCKLPNGLILEMGSFGDENYKAVTLEGSNSVNAVSGFGLTRVDEDLWTAWAKAHSFLPALRQGMIFSQVSDANAQAAALDNQSPKTGLEPLIPDETPEGIAPVTEHMEQGKRDILRLKRA